MHVQSLYFGYFDETGRERGGQTVRRSADLCCRGLVVTSVFGQFLGGAALLLCSLAALSNEETPAQHSRTPEIAPVTTGSDEFGSPELIFQQQDEPVLVAPDAASYQFYIADLESREGPYAEGLSEQLLGLGASYQNQNLHDAAIEVFKRGIHIARVNGGLNGADQIPLLQSMINSLLAKGDFDKANERQNYLFRVQLKVYGAYSQEITEAMLQRAAWELRAFHLTTGDISFIHLLTMGELYGGVLRNISRSDGMHSLALIPPLLGLLETQYLISTYGDPAGVHVAGSTADTHYVEENRFAMMRASNYKKGQAVITALRDVYDYNEGEQSLMSVKTWVMLGDWHIYNRKRDSAEVAYQRAWDELAALENGGQFQQEYLGQLVRLPDFPGFARDLVPPSVVQGYAEVSYIINRSGRVRNLEILKLEPFDETDQREPVRLIRRIKRSLYRPLTVDRELAATETINKRYAY
jgi:hypothetical protein